MKSRSALFMIIFFVIAVTVRAENHWPAPPEKGIPLPEPTLEVKSMSLSELFSEAQQYTMTPQARANKIAAKKQFFSYGPNALAYLLSQLDVENLWLRVYAYELARSMPAEKAVPVLIAHLDISKMNQTRYALHILGFFEAPEVAPDLSEFFTHEKMEGASIRLAGKWKLEQYLPEILPYVTHEKERLRIMAVNALRDLGLEKTRPGLEGALNDPFFTVRNSAKRALETLAR